MLLCLRTVLYARYPNDLESGSKLDSAHKARNVGTLVLMYSFKKELVDNWLKSYQKSFPNEDPFSILAQQRRTGPS
jgi:hypothetical protein